MPDHEPNMPKSAQSRIAQQWAKDIAALCVRMTNIEQVHAGVTPQSRTGDYSDIRVVTPFGEIPWTEVSRISDDEMRDFMQQVTNRLYTVLSKIDDVKFMQHMHTQGQRLTAQWDDPKLLTDWCTGKWADQSR